MNREKIEALEQIRAEGGGVLHPANVVEAAQDPASPLHADFEWDDGEAAIQHRLNQARTLIRAVVRIMPAGNRGPVPGASLRLSAAGSSGKRRLSRNDGSAER